MKRSIPEEEYVQIAKANPFALNTNVLTKAKRIINEFNYWLVVNNKYPYVEYNGCSVLKHLLIVPKDDNIDAFYKIKKRELAEMSKIIKFLTSIHQENDLNEDFVLVYFWKEKGKSINKFHLHFLVLKK